MQAYYFLQNKAQVKLPHKNRRCEACYGESKESTEKISG
jgi:hypothetical protein